MVAPTKRKQDLFQAFYTNCNHITSFMVGLLQCNNSTTILEPCAGDGAFIDEILKKELLPSIKAYELNDISTKELQGKYGSFPNIEVEHGDFLLLLALFTRKYDRIIGNPPYGAYQSTEKRKILKKRFPTLYAKETYGLFLARSMEMLKNGGRLVFIIPDTYLTLHMHEGLRKEIVSKYKIESITLFPSNFFPGVNFGYAGLSIISIINEKTDKTHQFSIYKGLKEPSELSNLLTAENNKYEICQLSYETIVKTTSYAFFLPSEKWISSVISSRATKVGDLCSVVTGFYSGNDAKHLRRSASVTRGVKKYVLIDDKDICKDDLSVNPPLKGINNKACWVPIVKGGNKRFYKPSEWFMEWGVSAIHEYRVANKKKARFQNSQFYFRNGIGVPMVSSSSITASLINKRLFDQSIVGLFPHKEYEDLTYYILGFFNSRVCTKLIRTINASTNNSANYIKKIPLIIPPQKIINNISMEVERLIHIASNQDILENELQDLNNSFDQIYEVEVP